MMKNYFANVKKTFAGIESGMRRHAFHAHRVFANALAGGFDGASKARGGLQD